MNPCLVQGSYEMVFESPSDTFAIYPVDPRSRRWWCPQPRSAS